MCTRSPSEKDNLTVLGTFSAAGEIVPGMIVYPYVKIPRDIANNVPDGWIIGALKLDGYAQKHVMSTLLMVWQLPWLQKTKVPLPVVLFVDGHRSHLSMKVSSFCAEHDIILLSLPQCYPHPPAL